MANFWQLVPSTDPGYNDYEINEAVDIAIDLGRKIRSFTYSYWHSFVPPSFYEITMGRWTDTGKENVEEELGFKLLSEYKFYQGGVYFRQIEG